MGRELSFWGWGYADKFADRKSRESLGQLVRSIIDCPELTLREPPSIDSIQLRRPRIEVPGKLQGFCSSEKSVRLSHSFGKAYPDIVRGFAGQYSHPPDLVARPQSEADIEAVYQWAGENRVAVVPFGGGTSVVGGVDCEVGSQYRGVVSLDLRCLDKVLEIDKESRAARIQAGATGPLIEKQLAEHGLTLRHFPQSFEFSTLGG
ncbi:MAG: FAD-dependent oxidoreductase, partial [Planctomycetota bacterium]|nr:FAD-dependent oxidoreductase [Planctomycetota bacterium]